MPSYAPDVGGETNGDATSRALNDKIVMRPRLNLSPHPVRGGAAGVGTTAGSPDSRHPSGAGGGARPVVAPPRIGGRGPVADRRGGYLRTSASRTLGRRWKSQRLQSFVTQTCNRWGLTLTWLLTGGGPK